MIQRRMGVVESLPLLIAHAGASPVRQGEAPGAAWTVETGKLRAWLIDQGGRELWLDILGPGDLVGEQGGGTSAWTVTTLGPSRLRVVPADALGIALAARSERMADLASQLAWLGVRERVERRLCDLAGRLGRPATDGVVIPFRLTQDHVAALVGTTRESANRAVRELVARGRISVEGRGRYVVHPHLRAVKR